MLRGTCWWWLVACALSASCSRADHDDGRTWPVWQRPPEPPAPRREQPEPSAPVHALPSGVVGLSPDMSVEPPSATSAEPWADLPVHVSVFHHLTHVFEAPRPDARAIAYARRGASLRAGEEAGRDGCEGGWHPVFGGGFICRGRGYKMHASQPEPDGLFPAPERLQPLPYRYVKVVAPAAQTWRLPDAHDEEALEALVAAEMAAQHEVTAARASDAGVAAPATDAAAQGAAEPVAEPDEKGLPSWVRMIDVPGHYLTIAGEVERDDGRTFLRTVRGAFVPRDAVLEVQPPAALGQALRPGRNLPLGFAVRTARRFRIQVDGSWRKLPTVERGTALALTGKRVQHQGQLWAETTEGEYVQLARLAVAEEQPRPALVPAGARWVHVDLPTQTLVAYEGDRPVFATLVSSGKAGFETPAGLHRIHAKHVTTTMDDMAAEDGAYYIEDVPWTMYFEGSYALHAAFWHDRFGHPRSHGCVNLSPGDAQWLFSFVQPHVPVGMHGVLVPGSTPSYVLVDDGRSS